MLEQFHQAAVLSRSMCSHPNTDQRVCRINAHLPPQRVSEAAERELGLLSSAAHALTRQLSQSLSGVPAFPCFLSTSPPLFFFFNQKLLIMVMILDEWPKKMI